MNKTLKCKGELVNLDDHNIHIYRSGNKDKIDGVCDKIQAAKLIVPSE